jgi:malonyl-CoA O-methyltransferase
MTDKTSIAQNFSDAAGGYDDWAVAQDRIAARLSREMLPAEVRRVLDLGCGTGLLTHRLRARYPHADILATDLAPGMIARCRERWPDARLATFTVADADALDECAAYDLIATSCSFQWFARPCDTLQRIRRALTDTGRLALAAPVAGSFPELHESWRAAGLPGLPGLRLWSADDYRRALADADLHVATCIEEDVSVLHTDPWRALRSFRGIGALVDRAPIPPSMLRRLVAHYARAFADDDGLVTLTYRVVYLKANT